MFEGLVQRVLVGYLGRYVKDIQKDQLKLSLWNEEVLLENVELIPEAFDYLQLPFALKKVQVGKLSIKISWKKLGWDHPVIIVLEDVFVTLSQRDDQEWSLNAVERREIAGKKAQLAAAELAKLSRRVCDNQAGNSFISYITVKVLDSIQVSIKNFHVQYREMQFDSAQVLFGLKFSSLTVKQNLVGSYSGKVVGGQVNKILEIEGLEIYCGMYRGAIDSRSLVDSVDSKLWYNARSGDSELEHLIEPFNMSVSLVVNKTGKVDGDIPQYSIRADLTGLALSLNEVQLQQLLNLLDYLSTSRLRERYGRYRPWSSLSRTHDGWQKLWWHYAQKSILADVHKKLKKTSWRYLGQRLCYRRKYINLYKIKLDFIQQERSIEENVFWELEQMEKESDIDEILSYRSAAESELKEVFSNSSSSYSIVNAAIDKSRNDGHALGRSRGWLNWLSRGMLGAGGTDDSSQFSGVVSDEVVKDIYEATKFHPSVSSGGDADANDRIFTCAISFRIGQISARLRSKNSSKKIADLILKDAAIECKICEELLTSICFLRSGELVYPCKEKVIVQAGEPLIENTILQDEPTPCRVQVDVLPKQGAESSVNVILQPLVITYDMDFFLSLMEFLLVFRFFEFHHQRILSSLNGIEDTKTRLLSKAEYIFSNYKILNWDVSITNLIINVPWRKAESEEYNLFLELGSLVYTSKSDVDSAASSIREKSCILKQFSSSTSTNNSSTDLQVRDLYKYFDIELNNFELKLMVLQNHQTISILEQFCASIIYADCIIPDELTLKKFEAFINLSPVTAKFSSTICDSVLSLISHLDTLPSKSESLMLKNYNSQKSNQWTSVFGFSVTTNLELVNFYVDLTNDGENSSDLLLSLQELDVGYSHTDFEDCLVCAKAVKVISYALKGQNDSHIIFSSGNYSVSGNQQHIDAARGNRGEKINNESACTETCFHLHYEAHRSADLILKKCAVVLSNADLHCYPHIFGLLIGFYNRICLHAATFASDKSLGQIVDAKEAENPKQMSGFKFQRFGYSNFFETASFDPAGISLDCYPFITIRNSGYLDSLESSLCFSIPEWKKLFKLRDRKPISPEFSSKKASKAFHAPSSTYSSGMDASDKSGISCNTNGLNIEINLCGIKVHFHDSSCILGTVDIPTSKSALSIRKGCMDLLCSMEGLVLRSCWWTKNFHDFLWGPSLPNLSPILNISLRTGLTSQLEVCIGIQHVCCILPPEYLAIIIGYFSLPDWNSNVKELSIADNNECSNLENAGGIMYKFEILYSTLVLPVEYDDLQFLKIELQQMYCSFIQKCALNNILKDPNIVFPAHKLAKENHCLNIFGRDLSLSLLLCEDNKHGLIHQDTVYNDITLIGALNADVWVRLPCDSSSCRESSSISACIISRIGNCEVSFDDCCRLNGFDALLNVINQLSSVDEAAKYFTSDVLHFLQLRGNLKGNDATPLVHSSVMFTDVQCNVDSLSITFYRSREGSRLSKQMARADIKLIFSASLINETPISLNFSFSSVELNSLLNSVLLARCSSTSSDSSALQICFSKSIEGDNQLHILLPSLDIWLHLLDWMEIIDFYDSHSKRRAQIEAKETSLKNLHKGIVGPTDNVFQSSIPNASSPLLNEHVKQDSVILTLRSGHMGLTMYIPFPGSEVSVRESAATEVEEKRPQNASSNTIEGKNCKFIAVTTHSSSSELFIVGRNVKLKSILEKTSGSIRIYDDKSTINWPFFQISQVTLGAEISNNQMEIVTVNLEVQCDRLDVWLSHQVLCFCYGLWLDIAKVGPSRSLSNSMNLRIQLKKISLLISDERWSCGGPLLEILMRNCLLHSILTLDNVECSVTSDLEVNYNNIHKVWWEPFLEPWKFQISMIRKHEMTTLLNSSVLTDIQVRSTSELNLNITESLFECVFRTIEMITDACYLMGPNDLADNHGFLRAQFTKNINEGRYAPYMLQNLTSLPLKYHVLQGLLNTDEFDISEMNDGKYVQPGASVPIYPNENPEELLLYYRPAQSSGRLSEKQSNGVVHHFMSIQFDGTSLPSAPISMDLVGIFYFEVDFSKVSNNTEVERTGTDSNYHKNIEERNRSNTDRGFIVPVVFDVSLKHYSKLIKVYSTVILSNATSMPVDLRFDIPFGVSPKILDPIFPGQDFPLPLHLAEAGRMRWRPIGNSYLWSELHDLSNILSQETKNGFLKSSVCYPSHPSSDPFRCCISIQRFSLPSSGKPKKYSSLHVRNNLKQPIESYIHDMEKSKKRFVYLVTLFTPLIFKNYLPDVVSLTIDAGGIARKVLLSEVETSFNNVDLSHDLRMELYVHGFKPSSLKFPRGETFSTMANLSGNKFFLSETISFEPDLSNGPLYVTVEKMMDAFSGAREVFISVPFLLYNCTNLPLNISECGGEDKKIHCTIPSCYDLSEQDLFQGKKDGLSLLSSDKNSFAQTLHSGSSLLKGQLAFDGNNSKSSLRRSINNSLTLSGSSDRLHEQSDTLYIGDSTSRDIEAVDNKHVKVKACMYSPHSVSSVNEVMVRLSMCLPEYVQNVSNSPWSEPFLLVPPSGSSTIPVPRSSSNAAYVISVTSSAVAGSLTSQTQAITFQPRFIISNACSNGLCYKQKGTDFSVPLGVAKHSHLHWTDTKRELLVSICFDEPGWQWSGSFSPDYLGDTQLKMRNYISGALQMIRVEVQNADVSICDEKIVGSLHGNSGTHLILLSDDTTGFMPYRIDNFSRERLRIYQPMCETFETIIHPYTSCPYSWDEPCYPHRLTVEVPGERVVGLYALDDLKEYTHVHLKSTSEKPERTLLFSVHAEGATKVLSIVDSSYHILKDVKNPSSQGLLVRDKHMREEMVSEYRETFSLAFPYIGISLVNTHPQELLFVCAKNISLDMHQSLDQQKLSFQISSLQIDNQLQTTPYPVILSFNKEQRNKSSNAAGHKAEDDGPKSKSEKLLQITSESSCEPVIYLALATWRKDDISLVSFEYISLRIANFCLELDQELILSLLDFFKVVSSQIQSRTFPFSEPIHYPLLRGASLIVPQTYGSAKTRENLLNGNNFHLNKRQISSVSLPSVVPIGAPWQKIFLLARRQKKIYIELFDVAPIKFILSFSSAPWMARNGILTPGESLIHRGLVALADVEGARIHLKQLTIAHHMASLGSMQDILIRHYTRQLLHEIYKVFGSAGVIGNPMGFARSLGLGIRDFLSVPTRSILQSPAGLITGMAQGTTSLLSNTVYALSDAATQFSKTAHKGIVAFTFDNQSVARMEDQQKAAASHSKGVISEVLEGLTGLLQSPIKEAERHGLPGIFSGIALGVAGVVARPAASILEVTGKTAQSIRNRSKLYQMGSHRNRVRLPRPLSREHPLRPYSFEEAVGKSVLMEVDDCSLKLKDEVLVMCKLLKSGKFVVVTGRLMLIASCSSLGKIGKSEFEGVPIDMGWLIESEIGLESVIHVDVVESVVHIVGSSSDAVHRQNQQSKGAGGTRRKQQWSDISTHLPLFQTDLELTSKDDAMDLLQTLLSAIEQCKARGSGSGGYLLHRSSIIYSSTTQT